MAVEPPAKPPEGSNDEAPQIAGREEEGRERRYMYMRRFFVGQRAIASQGVGESLKGTTEDTNFTLEDYFGTKFSGRKKEEISAELREKLGNNPTYESFVKSFIKKRGLSKKVESKMSTDDVLKPLFVELIDYDFSKDENAEQSKKEFRGLSVQFQKKLFGYTKENLNINNDDLRNLVLDFRRGRRLMKIDERLLSSNLIGDDFYQNRIELDDRYSKGELREDEYIAEMESLYDVTVKDSGDDELKALWNSDEQDEESTKIYEAATAEAISSYLATPITSKGETMSAVKEVSSAFAGTNFSVEFANEGVATVKIADFSLDLSVYKDLETQEFVYFVGDSYTHGQRVGPITTEQLPAVIDGRRVDAYLTKRIGKITTNTADIEGIARLPDNTVELLGVRLLGAGESRGFDIAGQSRKILDRFVPTLIARDDDYPTMERKVRALNLYFAREENVVAARAKLLSGEKYNVTSLLNRRVESLDEVMGA